MKTTMLKKNKVYYLRKKGSRAVSDIALRNITLESSQVSYWYFEDIAENIGSEGTPYQIYAVIPRMAGSDYFVDHGGEVLRKTVIVPYGEFLTLHPALSVNPQTGECLLDESYVLAED